eukprot:4458551-Prymnesium_polylepis.1
MGFHRQPPRRSDRLLSYAPGGIRDHVRWLSTGGVRNSGVGEAADALGAIFPGRSGVAGHVFWTVRQQGAQQAWITWVAELQLGLKRSGSQVEVTANEFPICGCPVWDFLCVSAPV